MLPNSTSNSLSPSGQIEIVFDSPQKTYLPGAHVSGKVLLNTVDAITARFLKIEAIGRSKVSWRGRFGGKQKHTKNHVTSCTLAWAAKDGQNKLSAGEHRFKFSFRLPADAPPSFEGEFGSIEYSMRVTLDRPLAGTSVRVKKTFTVAREVNMGDDVEMMGKAQFFRHRQSGRIIKNGMFSLEVTLPKRGFVAGEEIVAAVTVTNNSGKPIKTLDAHLIQQSHYHLVPGHTCSVSSSKGCPLDDKHRRLGEQRVSTAVHHIDLAPFSTKQIEVKLPVGDGSIPTFESEMLSVGYLLSFNVKTTSAAFGDEKLKCNARLLIGTVREEGEQRRPPTIPLPRTPTCRFQMVSSTPRPVVCWEATPPPPPYDPRWRRF